jgi:hypothetical protein
MFWQIRVAPAGNENYNPLCNHNWEINRNANPNTLVNILKPQALLYVNFYEQVINIVTVGWNEIWQDEDGSFRFPTLYISSYFFSSSVLVTKINSTAIESSFLLA